MGIVAPLILSKANETSIAGTLSGFLRVQSDPQNRVLSAQLNLSSPDLSVELPELHLTENQINLQADLLLQAGGELAVQKVMVGSRQAGVDWLELSAGPAGHPGLAVVGKVDLGILQHAVPAMAPYVQAGKLLLKADVDEPRSGLRKVGFSLQAQSLTCSFPGIGVIPGLQANAQGILELGQEGFRSLSDLDLQAQGPAGDLQIGKLDWQKNGALAWESARLPPGWVAMLAGPWLRPNSWVEGSVVLGQGFWEPGEHGSSGAINLLVSGGRISTRDTLEPVSCRLEGDWEYDNRTESFTGKDASVGFFRFDAAAKKVIELPPVEIPSCRAGPGRFEAKLEGGVLDLRGLLDQFASWQSAPTSAPGQPIRLELSADLDQVVLPGVSVGPVHIQRFRYGPDGVWLQPSSAEMQEGVIRASIVETGEASRPVQLQLFVEKFPLEAILRPMIRDARGPLGGWADLTFRGWATGAKFEELQQTLSGQGKFQLYQAHLENLPAIAKALQSGGALLGSSFIGGSQINEVGASYQVAGTRISTEDLQVTGTALQAGMRGWVDWLSQTIDFRFRMALTREAIQSSGQLQGVMTQLVGNNTGYFTQIPGTASITGTLADPRVDMDVGKMLLEGGINLLVNAPSGILQGAGNAAGGATGAAGQIFQALPIPFFGR